jgi:hypothetical protein
VALPSAAYTSNIPNSKSAQEAHTPATYNTAQVGNIPAKNTREIADMKDSDKVIAHGQSEDVDNVNQDSESEQKQAKSGNVGNHTSFSASKRHEHTASVTVDAVSGTGDKESSIPLSTSVQQNNNAEKEKTKHLDDDDDNYRISRGVSADAVSGTANKVTASSNVNSEKFPKSESNTVTASIHVETEKPGMDKDNHVSIMSEPVRGSSELNQRASGDVDDKNKNSGVEVQRQHDASQACPASTHVPTQARGQGWCVDEGLEGQARYTNTHSVPNTVRTSTISSDNDVGSTLPASSGTHSPPHTQTTVTMSSDNTVSGSSATNTSASPGMSVSPSKNTATGPSQKVAPDDGSSPAKTVPPPKTDTLTKARETHQKASESQLRALSEGTAGNADRKKVQRSTPISALQQHAPLRNKNNSTSISATPARQQVARSNPISASVHDSASLRKGNGTSVSAPHQLQQAGAVPHRTLSPLKGGSSAQDSVSTNDMSAPSGSVSPNGKTASSRANKKQDRSTKGQESTEVQLRKARTPVAVVKNDRGTGRGDSKGGRACNDDARADKSGMNLRGPVNADAEKERMCDNNGARKSMSAAMKVGGPVHGPEHGEGKAGVGVKERGESVDEYSAGIRGRGREYSAGAERYSARDSVDKYSADADRYSAGGEKYSESDGADRYSEGRESYSADGGSYSGRKHAGSGRARVHTPPLRRRHRMSWRSSSQNDMHAHNEFEYAESMQAAEYAHAHGVSDSDAGEHAHEAQQQDAHRYHHRLAQQWSETSTIEEEHSEANHSVNHGNSGRFESLQNNFEGRQEATRYSVGQRPTVIAL